MNTTLTQVRGYVNMMEADKQRRQHRTVRRLVNAVAVIFSVLGVCMLVQQCAGTL